MPAINLEAYINENVNNPVLKVISETLSPPIYSIQNNLHLLKRSCNQNDILSKETFFLSEESIKILNELVRNINFLCKDDKSSAPLKKTTFVSLLKEVTMELKRQNYKVNGIVFETSSKNEFILQNSFLLKQILVNLLSNSLKFACNKAYSLIEETDENLTLIVQDYGIGIPSDEISSIFLPFFRASNAKYYPGAGLGLPVVARSVFLMQGKIEVKSSSGKGTLFKIKIPLIKVKE